MVPKWLKRLESPPPTCNFLPRLEILIPSVTMSPPSTLVLTIVTGGLGLVTEVLGVVDLAGFILTKGLRVVLQLAGRSNRGRQWV